MGAETSTKAITTGFGCIRRRALHCWLKRAEQPFGTVAYLSGSKGAKTVSHLLNNDTVIRSLQDVVSCIDNATTIDGKSHIAIVSIKTLTSILVEFGVKRGDYDSENGAVIPNAFYPANGRASFGKAMHGRCYAVHDHMTTAHSYFGGHMI